MTASLPRILCVDDEAHVLDGLSRVLRHHFEVVTARGGMAGREQLEQDQSFLVVISDMRMPGIDGVGLLSAARRLVPDASRILLTGQADVRSAIAAVNEGRIYRFLTKPCPPQLLIAAIEQAVEQHRLVTAERVLLEQTLHQAVQALVEVLSLANPVAFGRASRARRLIGELATLIGFRDRWQMEMAAMLSQVGAIALPADLAERYYHGRDLSPAERERITRLPEVALGLIGAIPRLEEIQAILRHAGDHFAGGGHPAQGDVGEEIPLGARLLRVVLDYDDLCSQGHAPEDAVSRLEARTGWYDPAVLADLRSIVGVEGTRRVLELRLTEVRPGMVFVDDVRSGDGTLLVARGQEVTASLLHRIEAFWGDLAVAEPIRVHLPEDSPAGKPGSPTAVA
jgi:response regulator RpfG family c-di-GMP phosphodiesterase